MPAFKLEQRVQGTVALFQTSRNGGVLNISCSSARRFDFSPPARHLQTLIFYTGKLAWGGEGNVIAARK